MAGEQGTFHRNEDQRDKTKTHVLPQPCSSLSLGESSDIEVLFRIVESKTPVEPSIERWAQFNERVMERVVGSLQCRPTFRQWRQTLLDRFLASDSRLKIRMWVILATVVLATCLLLGYLTK